MALEIPFAYFSLGPARIVRSRIRPTLEIKQATWAADFVFIRYPNGSVYIVKHRYGASGWTDSADLANILGEYFCNETPVIFGRDFFSGSMLVINKNGPSDFKPLIMVL